MIQIKLTVMKHFRTQYNHDIQQYAITSIRIFTDVLSCALGINRESPFLARVCCDSKVAGSRVNRPDMMIRYGLLPRRSPHF